MKRRGFLKGAAIAGGGAAWGAISGTARGAGTRAASLPELLERAGLTASARLLRYGGSHPTEVVDVPLAPGGAARRPLGDATW